MVRDHGAVNTSKASSWSLTPDDFDSLAAGAALLGSGGGGDGRIGQNLLSILPPDTRVTVVLAEELPDDASVIHVGTVGSPDVVSERLLDPADFARAAKAVADLVERDVDAIGCIEIGGLNALISVLVSVHIGVPIVDGDLMGRAFPRIHMTLLSAHGRRSTPLSLVSPSRDVAVLKDGSPRRLEAMLSAIVSSMGGAAALAIYPVLAAELRQIGMGPSLSHCLDIGRAFRRNMNRKTTELTELIGGQLVAEGGSYIPATTSLHVRYRKALPNSPIGGWMSLRILVARTRPRCWQSGQVSFWSVIRQSTVRCLPVWCCPIAVSPRVVRESVVSRQGGVKLYTRGLGS